MVPSCNRSLYIDRHTETDELLLDGAWRFLSTDEPTDDIASIPFDTEGHTAHLPASVAICLYDAGLLPHPYVGTNSEKYAFIKDKLWYFRRTFMCRMPQDEKVYLCFDGAGYTTRVWLNGQLLGSHEGLFGGPVIEVSALLNEGVNTLTAEVAAADCKIAPHLDGDLSAGMIPFITEGGYIVPWNVTNDSLTSNGHFNAFGIWRSVRLEYVKNYHINNPYIFTVEASAERAVLRFDVPVATPMMREEDGLTDRSVDREWLPRNVYSGGFTTVEAPEELTLTVTLTSPDGACAAKTVLTRHPYTFKASRTGDRPDDYLYFTGTLTVEKPSLWFPNGLGEQPLYTVCLALSCDGVPCDERLFRSGIRTVKAVRSAGEKYYARWENFQFVINGRPFFVKGMNMTPQDQLYREDPDEIRQTLTMVKNAGIGMVRIWNGGGVPESDTFYTLCDELGLLVWQDAFIANSTTPNVNNTVLRCQLFYTLMRIRNHPSFCVFCGGNEFNPYAPGNAASMYATIDLFSTLIPDRIFYRTTPDGGSAHVYRDMEPTHYRHEYRDLPFLAESGIHNFPTAKTLRRVLNDKEMTSPLDNIFSDEFPKAFPDLFNRFSEFQPDRVPRMLARASHIDDICGITVDRLTEATQVSAYEYYLILIESMLENYPVTTGVMPWVFKRPWPTSAIQLVDGFGNPGRQYYAVKAAYEPIHPLLSLDRLNYRPGETLSCPIRIYCTEEASNLRLAVEAWDAALTPLCREEYAVSSAARGIHTVGDLSLALPDAGDGYVLIRLTLRDAAGALIGESLYWPKVLAALNDEDEWKKEQAEVCPNRYFTDGPFLRKTMEHAPQTALAVEDVISDGDTVTFTVKNTGDVPAFPVTVDAADDETACLVRSCGGGFFLLAPGESRTVSLTLFGKNKTAVTLGAWNARYVTVGIER